MKSILIPVDFTSVTQNVLAFAADFCREVAVEEIILFKSFHLPALAQVLISIDQSDDSPFTETQEGVKIKLEILANRLRDSLPPGTKVLKYLTDDKWMPAMQELIEKEQPELVILGNDPSGGHHDSSIVDQIIPFSKVSTVPVLVVPVDAVYKKLKRVLIPTSFKNLERLRLMEQLCTSQAWLQADLMVLNVDPTGEYMMVQDEHPSILDQYLQNYHYQLSYSGGEDIVQEILDFAESADVQLIMALPGKHDLFYRLTHQRVTETFALNAHHAVLLLK